MVLRVEEDGTSRPRHLRATAGRDGNVTRLEIVTSIGDKNFQDRIALLGEETGETTLERNVSLQMLRRPASTERRKVSTSWPIGLSMPDGTEREAALAPLPSCQPLGVEGTPLMIR